MALEINGEIATAITAALFGGVGVKIIDKVLSRRTEHLDESHRLRGELRQQIDALTKDLTESEQQVDIWRGKYWTLIESDAVLKTTITKLHADIEQLHSEVKELTLEITRIKMEIDPYHDGTVL